jgi:hypothetical protein
VPRAEREQQRARKLVLALELHVRSALWYGLVYGYATAFNLDAARGLEFSCRPPADRYYGQSWANGVLREVALRSAGAPDSRALRQGRAAPTGAAGHLEAWLQRCGGRAEQQRRSHELLQVLRLSGWHPDERAEPEASPSGWAPALRWPGF